MNPQPKYKPITSKRIPLNSADLALLPSPDKVNVSEWIREAIREKAEREQARDRSRGIFARLGIEQSFYK